MISFLKYILETYGLGVANLAFLGWICWKYQTNHYTHILASLKTINKKLTKMDDRADMQGERISKIEGRLEG